MLQTGLASRSIPAGRRSHRRRSCGSNTVGHGRAHHAEMGRYRRPRIPAIQRARTTKPRRLRTRRRADLNGARNIWVTETALATALDMGIHVGDALDLQHHRRHRGAADRIGLVIPARSVFGRGRAEAQLRLRPRRQEQPRIVSTEAWIGRIPKPLEREGLRGCELLQVSRRREAADTYDRSRREAFRADRRGE